MSDGYTDRFGFPLTAAQSAARLNRGRGFFNKDGRWVRLPAKKVKADDAIPAPRPADDPHDNAKE